MKRHFSILAALSTALMTTIAGTASADNSFSLHLEPGVAVPLSSPQSGIYSPGLALGAKGMFALTPNFAVGPSVSTMYLPRSTDNGQNAGVLWQFGGSARLQTDRRTSYHNRFLGDFSPWVDVDLMAADTGGLVLPAADLGLGGEMPLDQNHIFWLGPFVRYTHVFQTADNTNENAFGNVELNRSDVNILQVGLSFSFDAPTTPRVKTHNVNTVSFVAVHDDDKPCPAPVATKEVDQLNLTEKVYFDFDSANLRWESRDKLDAVVKQLQAHPKLAMRVDGHASADGQKAHNVALSARRTESVRQYLINHGVDATRLVGSPMGIDHPTAPNTTQEGRERNRRVEFVVNFHSVDATN
jgi:outer membrane protein OmpA-like peptidoglycan-associated protein